MDIRKKDPTPIGEADTTYPDWTGTAVAEDSLLTKAGDLYELAGLAGERRRWAILGIEIFAHSHGEPPSWDISVYAADRLELGVESFEDWAGVVERHGGIPVADIKLHDATFDDVIKCMKLISVQLRSRGTASLPLLHAGYGDHPPQE